MKTKILFIRMFVLSCILFILGFTVGSCSDDDDMDMLSSNSIRVGWQKRKKRVPVRMN